MRHERSEQSETDWKIVKTEFPFGDVPGPQGPQPAAPPLQLEHDGATVFVRGRIDRIDATTLGDHPAFTVIDYKTGKRPSFNERDLRSGRAVQLLLYALAVQRLGLVADDAVPFQLGYWCLKETGSEAEKLRAEEDDGHRSCDMGGAGADVRGAAATAGLRTGASVNSRSTTRTNTVSHCHYRTICRVNQTRDLNPCKSNATSAEPRSDLIP